MKAEICYDALCKTVKFITFNDMDAVSLHKQHKGFDKPVYLYVYDTRDRVYVKKAYAWGDTVPGTIVYLQEDEKKAKIITKAEYETFEVFQNDQDT